MNLVRRQDQAFQNALTGSAKKAPMIFFFGAGSEDGIPAVFS